MFSFAFLLLATVPAMATEFEIGTQFGFSHFYPRNENPSSSVSLLQVPSGEISNVGASPFLTLFPHKKFSISPEFNFEWLTNTNTYTLFEVKDRISQTDLYLGGKVHYFLFGHKVSNPYLIGKVSINTTFREYRKNVSLLHASVGAGYQWYIAPLYFLKLEGQYHSVFNDDYEHGNVLSVMMGLGVRFGTSVSNTSEGQSTQ